jgi:energy-coupling factor transport system ATP-binding protein
MNAIEITNLTFTYPGSTIPTLKNITLRVEQGDFLAIVGNNGCGKSSLCKTLNGLIPHFISGDFKGRVVVDGLDTATADVGNLALKAGYVYQDFENQIVRPTVLDDASYACLNYGLSDYKDRGLKALNHCGLAGKEKDYIWQLSGGQTHLLALAGAVSLSPDILILDEPIAQLDPRHADQIYNILKELNEKHNKTIIVIEHHTEYIAEYCKHVLLLKDGQAAWMLPAREALRRVEELNECNIFPPQVTIAAHHMKQSGLFPEDAQLPTTLKEGKKAFSNVIYNPAIEPEKNFCSTQETHEAAISLQNVSVSYRTVKGEPCSIFDNFNLDIEQGQKIALIGSNGAGKSTLMKLMIGLLKAGKGDVQLHGKSVRNLKPEELSRHISLVYQNPEEMFIKDSIQADIAYAMQARGISDWEHQTAGLLEQFRLSELKGRDGRLLSGGQMRRASLAIGIALNPGILLLDEPTANLDIATRKEIMRTLNEIKHITETVIIATHDMQLVCEWAERILVLYQGKVIADGTREEIFNNPVVMDQVGIRPPEIFSLGQTLDKRAFCYTVDDFLKEFGANNEKIYE